MEQCCKQWTSMVLLKMPEWKLTLGLKVRHKVNQSKTTAILSLPSSTASAKQIPGYEKHRLVHVSWCSVSCCLKIVCLPICSRKVRVSYKLNYFWIIGVFVVKYFCIPTLMPGMIIAVIPLRLDQTNCSHEQPQMQRRDSRGWKLWASWWDWEQPGGGGRTTKDLVTCKSNAHKDERGDHQQDSLSQMTINRLLPLTG